MFQEVKYGPWFPPLDSEVSVKVRAKKLVDSVKESVHIRQASICRPDKTSLFRDSFNHLIEGPEVPFADCISLSACPVHVFQDAYWRKESFSKLNQASEAEVDRLEFAAIEKLLAKELSNREINSRLRHFALTGRGLTSETAEAVRQAKRLIKRILGEFSWNRCVRFCRWGPGATTEMGRARSTPQNKWAVASHITRDCLPLLEAFSHWAKWEFPFDIVEQNRITTVPKKTTARRTIAIEPSWNMFFQLGIEGEIRRCLNKVGLLVDTKQETAQDFHKRLAKYGSQVEGLFPTLDFSDASNSITKGLCGLLLPTDWLVALMTVRANSCKLPDGSSHDLEMFSTMGNGYTFVLLTLLIFAVSTAVVGEQTSVFGDDLILPDASRYDEVVRVFSELGFQLNVDKSFAAAPFRESCGGHYFRGHDVTPPYFKDPLNCVPAYIKYANMLKRRTGALATPLWFELMKEIPRKFRGPEGYGDSIAVAPWDMVTPSWNASYQLWSGTTLVGYYPTREPSFIGRLRHGLYPGVSGAGEEVFRKEDDLLYRTGTWLSPTW